MVSIFVIFKKIGWFLKEHWIRYLIAITCLNVASLASIMPPMILGKGIDHMIQKTLTADKLIELGGLLFLVVISGFIVSYIWVYLLFGAGNILEYDLRKMFMKQILKMDAKFFEKNTVGDLMARATSDLRAISFTAGIGVLTIVDSSIYLVFLLVTMIVTINAKLTIFALLPLPFVVLIVTYLGRKIHSSFTSAQESFSELNNQVLESISGVRVIRAYTQEYHDIKRLKETSKEVYQKNERLNRFQNLFEPLFKGGFAISNLIALSYGTYLVFNSILTPGNLVTFTIYLGMLGWPMFAIGEATNIMQRGNASYDRVNNILTTKSSVIEAVNSENVDDELNQLKFNHYSFMYPSNDYKTINDINLKLQKGNTLGIVGPTGSGKTTLVKQLFRRYENSFGEISVNGINIKDISLFDLRSYFGYVPQEHIIFSGTVKENLSFGLEEVTEEKIEFALKFSAFENDIEYLDKGLETVVGEHGVMLSGGQKQRLSIARAAIIDPEVLILDDSLSAVDGNTERKIIDNILKYRKDKTTIIIAHRLSAVKHADEIIVLNEGIIKERGNHDELMKVDGWYKVQFNHQQNNNEEVIKDA